MPMNGWSVDTGAESSDADEHSSDRDMMNAEVDAIVGALDSLALQTNPSHVPCPGSSPTSESVRNAPSSLLKHLPSELLLQSGKIPM